MAIILCGMFQILVLNLVELNIANKKYLTNIFSELKIMGENK